MNAPQQCIQSWCLINAQQQCMQFACLIAVQQQCMQFVLLDGRAAAMHAALVLDDRPTGMETMVSGSVFCLQNVKRKYYEAGEQLSKNLLIIVVTCERSLHDTPKVGQQGFQWIGNGFQSPLTLIGKGRVYGTKRRTVS